MSSGGSSLWTQTVAVGIVVLASVIGNVSLSASEPVSRLPASVLASRLSPPRADLLGSASVVLSGDRDSQSRYSNLGPLSSRLDAADWMNPPLDTAGDSEPVEGGPVVPAIYAWDPDVRFVFYRHVSKWM